MASSRQKIATNVLTATRFRDLLRKVRSYRLDDDLSSIKKAYEFSLEHHKGQARESGEPYLVHPLEVATLLAEMRLDPTAIVAGLLHDAVEDTSVTIEEIKASGTITQRGIAEELNRREITAPRGGQWSQVQVMRLLA